MTRKTRTIAVLGLAGLLVAALPAAAMKMSFLLTPPADAFVKASGAAQLATKGPQELFKVRVFADLPDDTSLLVLVDRKQSNDVPGGLVPVGKIRMTLGSGLLVQDSERDVSAAFPVRSLHRVVVQLKGRTILEGSVPRAGTP